MKDLDEVYRTEGWGRLAEDALKIRPQDVESQARQVARYAAERIEALEAENVRLREALNKIARHDLQAIAMDALAPGERDRSKSKDKDQ